MIDTPKELQIMLKKKISVVFLAILFVLIIFLPKNFLSIVENIIDEMFCF